MESKIVFAILLLTLINPIVCSYVTLTSQGYEGIVVTFDENAPELSPFNCSMIVNWTQSFLQDSSSALSEATGYRAYFGNVTIIIPKSWATDTRCQSMITNNGSSWIRKNKETIKITSDHPIFGNQTYSFQYGGCGHPGLPIHLPISAVANSNRASTVKKFIHQWAHYRYGVFDEDGVPADPKYPSGFLQWNSDGGRDLIPNGCVDRSSIEGSWKNCSSKWDVNCEFSPRLSSYATTSLMYKPEIEKVRHFCTEETHKKVSPNKQNYFCNGRSTSEIIYQHEDFKSSDTLTSNSTVPIKFAIMEEPFIGYHFILDTFSFDDNELDGITNSMSHFIYTLPDGLSVSVDIFNDMTSRAVNLTVLLNETAKISVAKKLAAISRKGINANDFGTALRNGLTSASLGQDVIVLARSSSISSIDIQTRINEYVEAKVNCHTIFFGFPTFLNSTKLTRYGSFHVIPQQFENDLHNNYTWTMNTLQTVYSETRVHRLKIFEKTTNETEGETGIFYVDVPVSTLFFTVYSLNNEKVQVNTSSKIYFKSGGTPVECGIVPVSEFNVAIVTFSNELKGKGIWDYDIRLTQASSTRLRLEVWIESSDPSFIKTRSWSNAINNDMLDWSKTPVAIYTEVLQNRKPVNGAIVYANVYGGDKDGQGLLLERIPLKDEGDLDVTNGDGIYTGMVSNFSSYSQLYSVKIEISGMNSSAKVDSVTYNQHPTSGSRIVMTSPVTAAVQFNRFIYGPSFQTSQLYDDNSDKIPPSRVTDLSIAKFTNGEILLNWTAPKDNYGTGDSVFFFEVIQTYNGKEDIHPVPPTGDANNTVNISIKVPTSVQYSDVFYEVRAKDGAGNFGAKSNIVSVHIPGPSGALSATAWGLIGGGIALAVIIIIIVIICFFCPKTKEKIRTKTNQIRSNTRTKFSKNYKKKDKKNGKKEKSTSRTFTTTFDNKSTYQGKEEDGRQQSADHDKSSDSDSEKKSIPATYFGQEDVEKTNDAPMEERPLTSSL